MRLSIVTIVPLLVVALATAARADLPGITVTMPPGIPLVGTDALQVPDPAGEFVVTVRYVAGDPSVGSLVRIDFSACSDVRIAAQQSYGVAGSDCSQRVVYAVTGADGAARVRLVGGALNPGGTPGPTSPCAAVTVDNQFAPSLRVCAYDQSGFDGVGANDLSAFLSDFLAGSQPARSDYDFSGDLGATDLARWVSVFLAAGSIVGASTLPGGVCP